MNLTPDSLTVGNVHIEAELWEVMMNKKRNKKRNSILLFLVLAILIYCLGA